MRIPIARSLAAALLCALSASAPALAAERTASPRQECLELTPALKVCLGPAPAAPAPDPARGKGCADAFLMPDASTLERASKATLCLVNHERTSRGLPVLRTQSRLRRSATRYAARIVRDRFFSHVAPDGSTMLQRVRATGYLRGLARYWVGENIAYGYGTRALPVEIVEAWMASPGHRRNILERRFSEVGLGIALGSPKGAVGATYVHNFGRRVR